MPMKLAQSCIQAGYHLHVLSSTISQVSEETRLGRLSEALAWLPYVLGTLKTVLAAMPALEPHAVMMLESIKGAEDAIRDGGLNPASRLGRVDRMAGAANDLLDEAERICSSGG